MFGRHGYFFLIPPIEAPVNPRAVRSVTVQLRVEPDGAGRVVDLANRVLVRNVRS